MRALQHRWFAVALMIALATAVRAQTPDVREIDPAKSSAHFAIAHIFVDRVVGTVPVLSGSVTLTAGSAIPQSVSAVLDPTSIHTDEPDRDAALKSSDYFDTRLFPTWTFTSTKIEPAGPAVFGVDGALTMHGVSQREHLDVVVRGDAAHPVYHATGRIDRHAFGMKGARLDPVIGNAADITLDIVLK